VSVCLYIASIDNTPKSHKTFESTSALISNDFKNYAFSTSLLDLIIVLIIRTIILFKYFAYKHQKKNNKTPLIISIYTALLSSLFVVTKLYFCKKKTNKHLLLFSLIFVWICIIIFALFRRKDAAQFKRLYIQELEEGSRQNIYRKSHSIHVESDFSNLINSSTKIILKNNSPERFKS